MTYGVVDTGYNRKTSDVLDSEIKAKITEKLGLVSFNDLGIESIYTSVMISLCVENWEQNEALYHLMSPDNASGINLDNLLAIVNVMRNKPKKTTVVLTLGTNGDSDVLIPINQLVQQVNTNVIFKTLAEVTIPSSGTITVNAESQDYGSFYASIGTITQIVTPVSGWDTVTNLSESLVGQAYQEDPDYRYKKAVDLVTSQGGVAGAVETRVRNEVAGVTWVNVIVNNTDLTENGVLPHSIKVTVVGGTDEDVAKKIKETKGDGINTNGSIEVIVTDEEGNNTKIRFNRSEIIDIFVTYELSVTSSYDISFNDTIKDTVEAFNNSIKNGEDVFEWVLKSLPPITDNRSTINNISVKFGTSASPTTDTPITISNSQKARILRSNIVVNTTVI